MEIALITGGSRGLGRNMAYHLAKKGVNVVITYNQNEEKAKELISECAAFEGKIVCLKLDTAIAKSFDGFKKDLENLLNKNFGTNKINYLVNNAGHGLHKPIFETSEEDLDLLYQVHVKAPYLLTTILFPLITDGGKILNVSTGLARFSFPGYSAYASMKGAVEVMTRYMAKEFANRKISVNAIAPGAIETDFNGGVVRDNAQLNQHVAGATAMGRVGLPNDIGQTVADLLTSEANWMTAQRLEISGGMMV